MAFQSGTRLGPYEIVGLLGAGGMGEVYRARDPRLGRDVAVKVLPSFFAKDPERLQRFEQEARAAGQLNHPNVLAVYDVGLAAGAPYLVTELLEGATLREIVAGGSLPPRKAIEYVVQAAQGLSAAHAKGIVHRDLKPENLFVSTDGYLKILDFGLAKLARTEGAAGEETSPARHTVTATGEILGTVSYMAPEQLRAQKIDHRADLFALGAILYELLTAKKAFPGDTPADRMGAILRSDPSPLPEGIERAVPGVGMVIGRCLEKRPEARPDSARDLGFALELVLAYSAAGGRPVTAPQRAGAAAPGAGLSFQRLTFREGQVLSARFTPDGKTVVYSASWEGKAPELFLTRVESPEPRAIGLGDADLLSLASTSELAIPVRRRDVGGFVDLGTLARVPLMGGVPRELAEGVFHADWAPEGGSLAAIRQAGGLARLELPIGKVLYEAEGWLSHVRVSPDGRSLAVFHHPTRGDNAGDLLLIGPDGRARTLLTGWSVLWGLAWSPDGDALWLSGHEETTSSPGIFEVGRDGAARALFRAPGYILLQDVARTGEALVTSETIRMRTEFRILGESRGLELSWLDWSLLRDISPDGRRILFEESGIGVGDKPVVYMRDTDGSPPVRLGDGDAMQFSPDGRWALGIDREARGALVLHPTGPGESVRLAMQGLRCHFALWFPDGKFICVSGTAPGHRVRLYRYDIERDSLAPITEEGVGSQMSRVSPDGRLVIATTPTGGYAVCPTDGGTLRPLPGVGEQERPIQWTEDGSAVYVHERGVIPARVHRVEVETGRRELWAEITPNSLNGVASVNSVGITPDGQNYAIGYVQILSELHVARGLR